MQQRLVDSEDFTLGLLTTAANHLSHQLLVPEHVNYVKISSFEAAATVGREVSQ